MKSVTDYMAKLEGMSIADQADYWVIALDDDVDHFTELAFRTWLTQNPKHQAAYNKSIEIWKLAGQAVTRNDAQAFRPPLPRRTAINSRSSIWVASVIGVLLLGLLLMDGQILSSGNSIVAHSDFKSITLPDGSTAKIEASSEISFDFDNSARLVTLKQGGVYVDVTHNKNRPFKVIFSDIEVQAVGTAYSVQETDFGPLVTVHEGTVLISRGDYAPTKLSAGTSWHNGKFSNREITKLAYWRKGHFQVQNERLEVVLKRFSRQMGEDLIWIDPDKADIKISGLFHLNNAKQLLDVFSKRYELEKYSVLGKTAFLSKNIQN